MTKIQLLPDTVIDQIAAGEVVESPVSVIKELVENAIDAHASSIIVEIQKGGLELIRVADNGEGMTKEDMLSSLARHATSKIRRLQDLFSLETMGFRGEALASISSISEFTMRSSSDASGKGYEIQKSGGGAPAMTLCARQRGTDVIVQDLFFNVPARKEFQTGSAALTTKTVRLIEALSLCYPLTCFELVSNGKKVFSFLPGAKTFEEALGQKVKGLLGKPFFDEARWIDAQRGNLHLRGFLGSEKMTRLNRLGQFIFINNRWIQSPLISEIVKESYGTLLSERMHPSFVLHAKLIEAEVDVNVHPQKKEVRFKDPNLLRKRCLSALAPEKQLSMPVLSAPVFEKRHYEKPPCPIFQESDEPFEQTSLFEAERIHFQEISLISPYFFLKVEEELWIMNLRRAFTELVMKLADAEAPSSQRLLVPYLFDLSRSEMHKFTLFEDRFLKIGLEVREVSENTLSVDSIPSFIQEKDAKWLIRTCIDSFSEEADFFFEKSKKFKKSIESFTKSKHFSLDEVKAILNQVTHIQEGPIFKKIKKEDAGYLFGER